MENAPIGRMFRFEPTVFGAVRRYRTMVLAITVLAMAVAVGYSLMQGKTYQAQASITVPRQVSLQGQDTAQYLDSQVLLLRSPELAAEAASIANAALHGQHLSAGNFYGSSSALEITPPTGASPGAYGASIIGISFTWPSPRTAQVGVDAALQAFDDVRSAAITAQADAVVTGIDQALQRTSDQGQRATLLSQRTQTLLNEHTDLAHYPTVAEAGRPTAAAGGWKRPAAVGLVIGIIAGAALAYARASIRRRIADRREPEAIYRAPLIGEIPAITAGKTARSGNSRTVGPLPVITEPDSAAAEAFRFAAGSIERVRAVRRARLTMAFISPQPGAGKSTVLANLALAMAEGNTKVLVVDADASDDDVTARLLPGVPTGDGFEQALAGQRALSGCIQSSPLNETVAVLRSSPDTTSPVRGTARARAAGMLFAEARACFDVVLVDTPPLLRVADATELVGASDAAIAVINPDEPIRDHLDMADRLKLSGAGVAGYLYNRTPMQASRSRYPRRGASGRLTGPPDRGTPALADTQPLARVTSAPSHPPVGM